MNQMLVTHELTIPVDVQARKKCDLLVALSDAGFRVLVDDTKIPLGLIAVKGDESRIILFSLNEIDCDKVKIEHGARGLHMASPFLAVAVNAANAKLCKNHPNGTHWQDSAGNWYGVRFYWPISALEPKHEQARPIAHFYKGNRFWFPCYQHMATRPA